MMIDNVTILRKATPSDSAKLAHLDNIASHGLSLWFWKDAVKNGEVDEAWEYAKKRMADPTAEYGFANAVVAQYKEEVCANATGYILKHPNTLGIKENNAVLAPIFELFYKCEGHWLLDSLAVMPEKQGLGIGAKLLDNCFIRAREAGVRYMSLVAENANSGAIALYQSRGFEEVDRRKFVPFENEHASQYWVLYSVALN